jgi:hypothetical protein
MHTNTAGQEAALGSNIGYGVVWTRIILRRNLISGKALRCELSDRGDLRKQQRWYKSGESRTPESSSSPLAHLFHDYKTSLNESLRE